MRIYRPGLLSYMFIFIVLISPALNATNFFERHGNNFIYLESISSTNYDTLTYAPVIWDIGLIESFSEDILLLVINDSSEMLDDSTSNHYFVHFPNKNGLHYTSHYVAGFEIEQTDVSPDLALNFCEMPAYTASLYWFEYTGD